MRLIAFLLITVGIVTGVITYCWIESGQLASSKRELRVQRKVLTIAALSLEEIVKKQHLSGDQIAEMKIEDIEENASKLEENEEGGIILRDYYQSGSSPLHFRLTNDGSFIIYSVGPDGKDDFGNIMVDLQAKLNDSKGDIVISGRITSNGIEYSYFQGLTSIDTLKGSYSLETDAPGK